MVNIVTKVFYQNLTILVSSSRQAVPLVVEGTET